MSEQSAIICLPDDRDATGLKKPLMLQAMSGSPLLSWMVRLMRDSGYTDFLLSCDDEFRDAALACFPASAVTVTGPEPDAAVLRDFLSGAEDQLLVVTAPALLGGRALGGVEAVAQDAEDTGMLEGCGCYMVSAESIASVILTLAVFLPCWAQNSPRPMVPWRFPIPVLWQTSSLSLRSCGTTTSMQTV